MSRLDSVIRRLQAQRACLDRACEMSSNHNGVNNAHSCCVPADDHIFLGDLDHTLHQAIDTIGRDVVLVHSDVFTGYTDVDVWVATMMAECLPALMKPDCLILSDMDRVGNIGHSSMT